MNRSRAVIHTEREIAGIKRAAAATAWVLQQLCDAVEPGMTTLALDQRAEEFIAETGGTSAFHGYHGFPGQVCISLNDEVVHGIGRADRSIKAGDLVSLDVGVRLDGFIGDTARTVCAGVQPPPAAARLLHAGQASLAAGIASACGGNCVNNISQAVEEVVHHAGFAVVRDFVGHGCGCELHEPPEVPNFAQSGRGVKLRPGMVLAIEPMVNAGTERISVDRDGWTVRTADASLSVHFEHMVLITEHKPEVLTWPKIASRPKGS